MEVVECRRDPIRRSGYAERPLSLVWQGARHEIAEVISRWSGQGEKGFQVKTADGLAFEITYLEDADDWLVEPL
ncbi:MAG: hypothetical protein IT310_05445 [Anaerolineales bacterium]|nr:hypothetical protein [Anaerolineales bacterium]